MRRWPAALALLLPLLALPAAAAELALEGALTQGGLIRGQAPPGSAVALDGRPVRLSPEGLFLLGFGRDAAPQALLEIRYPDGRTERRRLAIAPRQYEEQRIDGLPERMVTPTEAELERIRADNARIAEARGRDTPEPLFAGGFVWPTIGRISGVYGSRRILNGEPRQPHYGIDIAAPVGAPVVAPADGIVSLAHPDMYFTGQTLMIDHGHGLSSAFLHLSEIAVGEGERVGRGQPIGKVGATGRVTGPHLDWRINLFEVRIDPALVVGPMPEPAKAP